VRYTVCATRYGGRIPIVTTMNHRVFVLALILAGCDIHVYPKDAPEGDAVGEVDAVTPDAAVDAPPDSPMVTGTPPDDSYRWLDVAAFVSRMFRQLAR
jgi:hypothetical protein